MTRSASYAVTVGWRYLERWIESQEEINLDLDPDFQRAHVWDEYKQTRYVEYILRGGKSSKDLYFNCVGWMGNFKGPSFTININDLATHEDVLRWYLDLNAGGVAHTEAELQKVRKLLHEELLSGRVKA